MTTTTKGIRKVCAPPFRIKDKVLLSFILDHLSFSFQVLFRYAIAVFKYMESTLLKQCDYMTIYNTLRDGLEYLTDTQTLTQVSYSFLVII